MNNTVPGRTWETSTPYTGEMKNREKMIQNVLSKIVNKNWQNKTENWKHNVEKTEIIF